MKKLRLNNMTLNHSRRDVLYQSIMADLWLMGVIPHDLAELYTNTIMNNTLQPLAGVDPSTAPAQVSVVDNTATTVELTKLKDTTLALQSEVEDLRKELAIQRATLDDALTATSDDPAKE